MPERLVDEETQTRTQSLCLFGVPGITRTSNRRCENCPGAPRTPQIHQKRCPLDISNEPNLFTQAAAAEAGKGEVIVDPKTLLASSSTSSGSSSSNAEQHATENVAVETSDEIQDDSLDESSRLAGRRPVRLHNIPSPTTYRSVSDPHSEVIGRKRKADVWPENASRNELLADPPGEDFVRSPKKLYRTESIVRGLRSLSIAPDVEHPGNISLDTVASAPMSLNQPEGILPRTEQVVLANFAAGANERNRSSFNQLDSRSDVREFLGNKELIIFQDHPHDKAAPMMVWGINASRDASSSSLFRNPTIMQEEHVSDPPALVSSLGICIPGIGMLSAQPGVPCSSDGIFNANDPEEYGLMTAMEIGGASDDESFNE